MSSILAVVLPDFVIHLASALRDDSVEDLIRTNITGTAALMHAVCGISSRKRPKVVIASTGGVYGRVSPSLLLLKESEPCQPADDYSRSKLGAEDTASALATEHGIPLALARIFNVIGAGQDERHLAGRVAAQLAAIAGNGGELRLGCLHCTRDFIDVRDVASALLLIAIRGQGILNVGTGREISAGEVVDEFCTVTGLACRRSTVAGIPAGVERSVAEITRIREIGFEPRYSLRASVEAVWEYYTSVS
jgi:nucleoside-diphosphate-sugar epimerase